MVRLSPIAQKVMGSHSRTEQTFVCMYMSVCIGLYVCIYKKSIEVVRNLVSAYFGLNNTKSV
jgi:hypothetical protein